MHKNIQNFKNISPAVPKGAAGTLFPLLITKKLLQIFNLWVKIWNFFYKFIHINLKFERIMQILGQNFNFFFDIGRWPLPKL